MTYYDVLEVSEKESDEAIRRKYRSLAKKYHPDKFRDDPRFADEKMKQLNAAYEILSDPVKRRAYDETLRNQRAQEAANAVRNAQQQNNQAANRTAQNRETTRYEQTPPVQENLRKDQTPPANDTSWYNKKPPVPDKTPVDWKKLKPLAVLAVAVVLVLGFIGIAFSGNDGWVEEGGKTYYYRDGNRVKGLAPVSRKSNISDNTNDIYYGFDRETGELLTGTVPADRLVELAGEALLADEITVTLDENGVYRHERWVWSDVETTWSMDGEEPSPYFLDYSVIPDFLARNVVYLSLEAEGIEPVSDWELKMFSLDRDGSTWGGEPGRIYWTAGGDTGIRYDPQQGTAQVEISREDPDTEYWDGERFVQEYGRANPENINGVKFCFCGPETEDGYSEMEMVQHSSLHISTLIQRYESQYESALIDMMETEQERQKRQEMESNVPYKGPMEASETTDGGFSTRVYYGYDKETGELLTGRVPAERFVELRGESLLADEITVVLDEEGKWEYEEWVFSDLDIVSEWETEGEKPWKNAHYRVLPWNYTGNIQYVVFEVTGAKPAKAAKDGEWWIRYCTDYQEDRENEWHWGSVRYDKKTDKHYALIDLRQTADYNKSVDVFALMYVTNPDSEDDWKAQKCEIGDVTIKRMVQHRTQYGGVLSDANR